jgi:hypothetical protein
MFQPGEEQTGLFPRLFENILSLSLICRVVGVGCRMDNRITAQIDRAWNMRWNKKGAANGWKRAMSPDMRGWGKPLPGAYMTCSTNLPKFTIFSSLGRSQP